MKVLEKNQETLKLKSDLNPTVALFMMLALGALVGTILFGGIIAIITFFKIPIEEKSLAEIVITQQQTIFILFGMMALGTLITTLFTPINTIYEINRDSRLFKVKSSYFIALFNELQEISLQQIKRIETHKTYGYGSIHLVLLDRSINISSDLELAENEAVEISESLSQFIKNS